MVNVDDLIGTPFEYKGRGPAAYDCYGLLRELYRRDGIDIPDYDSPTDGARISALMMGELRLWQETQKTPGAAVLLRVPGNLHVGYVLQHDRFIHTWKPSGGVVIERLNSPDWNKRILGFYRYVG